MPISRRDVLGLSGAAALAAAGGVPPAAAQDAAAAEDWEAVRGLFALSGDKVHMSAMLIASHPAPVRAAIEEHRRALDADPVEYLEANNARLGRAAREAAGRYLGVHPRMSRSPTARPWASASSMAGCACARATRC